MAAITEKAFKTVGGAAARRAQGNRPGVIRAFAGAIVAGALTGAVVYRLLRS
jgi:hypothetical protein